MTESVQDVVNDIKTALSTDNLAKIVEEIATKATKNEEYFKIFNVITSDDQKQVFGYTTDQSDDVLSYTDTNKIGTYDEKEHKFVDSDDQKHKATKTNMFYLLFDSISNLLDSFVSGSIAVLNATPIFVDSSVMATILKYAGLSATLAGVCIKVGALFTPAAGNTIANFGSTALILLGAFSASSSTPENFEKSIDAWNKEHKNQQVLIKDNNYNLIASFFAFYGYFIEESIAMLLLFLSSVAVKKAKEKASEAGQKLEEKSQKALDAIVDSAFKNTLNQSQTNTKVV